MEKLAWERPCWTRRTQSASSSGRQIAFKIVIDNRKDYCVLPCARNIPRLFLLSWKRCLATGRNVKTVMCSRSRIFLLSETSSFNHCAPTENSISGNCQFDIIWFNKKIESQSLLLIRVACFTHIAQFWLNFPTLGTASSLARSFPLCLIFPHEIADYNGAPDDGSIGAKTKAHRCVYDR